MILLDPRLWLALLITWAAAFGMGYFRGHRVGVAQTENAYKAAQLDASAEAQRINEKRTSVVQEATNGYIKARNREAASALSARSDLERVRDALDHAAEQHAHDAELACGDLQRRFDDLAGLFGSGASLVEEGRGLVAKLAAEKAVLSRAGQQGVCVAPGE